MAKKQIRKTPSQAKRANAAVKEMDKMQIPRIPMENVLSKRNYRFPTNKEAYLAYVFWCTLPSEWKNMSDEERADFGFNKDLGKIFNIKTQYRFAETFGISEETLRRWRVLDRWDGDLEVAQRSGVVQAWKNKIDYNFSKKTAEYGDAARVKLWHELYLGHEERHVIRHEGEVSVRLEGGFNFYDLDDIFPIALAKICARQKLDLSKVVYKLNNSYYSKLDNATTLAEVEKIRFPSQIPYDFDSVEEAAIIHKDDTLKVDPNKVLNPEDESDTVKRMRHNLAKLMNKDLKVEVPMIQHKVQEDVDKESAHDKRSKLTALLKTEEAKPKLKPKPKSKRK